MFFKIKMIHVAIRLTHVDPVLDQIMITIHPASPN